MAGRYLDGQELNAFVAAVERAAIEWAEAAQLLIEDPRQPLTADGWRDRFSLAAEAWQRHVHALADMVEAAIGEDHLDKFTGTCVGLSSQEPLPT